ncbi:autism susceptibility protein 2 [Platysternon megacephalum]|uniref:Autism susceptibility protein 2 n=1 Tax=Platysternon megacephalum TaxID=55544 RepID=A0A4D9EXK7_9SAUR|nr:autism susceptibility protein 2 [Platysternon megacephalum]
MLLSMAVSPALLPDFHVEISAGGYRTGSSFTSLWIPQIPCSCYHLSENPRRNLLRFPPHNIVQKVPPAEYDLTSIFTQTSERWGALIAGLGKKVEKPTT